MVNVGREPEKSEALGVRPRLWWFCLAGRLRTSGPQYLGSACLMLYL